MGIKVERSDKGKITREVQRDKISRIKIERYLEAWSYFGSVLALSRSVLDSNGASSEFPSSPGYMEHV